MNLLERHLERAYGPGGPGHDPARQADVDAWTVALWTQIAPEDADCDFFWVPVCSLDEARERVAHADREPSWARWPGSRAAVALALARLRGDIRARMLGAFVRGRWVLFVPRPWKSAPARLAVTGSEIVSACPTHGPPLSSQGLILTAGSVRVNSA